MSTLFECARCDATDYADTSLPKDWETRESVSIGTYCVCPSCASKDAPERENRALMEQMRTGQAPADNDVITGAAQSRLRTIIERIERLEEDRAVIVNDIKEVYAEAKGEGFDTKILKRLVALRKKDKHVRDEEDALLDLYMSAIGM
jgi:uncharacterized protein (UPF0335 family)